MRIHGTFLNSSALAVTVEMADYLVVSVNGNLIDDEATTYHQRFADKDFIEIYNGCVVGDQSAAIEKLRSACYDVFKQEHEPATALDMAFVAQIYATAVYQTTVTETYRHSFHRFFKA